MGKSLGPLFSVEAHGQIGKELVFSKRSSGQMVRKYHKPGKARTDSQFVRRFLIALFTIQWQSMTSGQKDVYNAQAEALANAKIEYVTGYNLFIRAACADPAGVHGLGGFWPMQESSGDQLLDYSGNGNDMQLFGGYSREKDWLNRAISFNGSTGYGKAVGVPITASFTALVWVKSHVTLWNDYAVISGNRDNNGFLINTNKDSTENVHYFVNSVGDLKSVGNYFTSPMLLWHLHGLTWNQDTHIGNTIYDGVIQYDVSLPAETRDATSAISVHIARDSTLARYGDISTACYLLYNRVLSALELKKIFNLTLK